MPGAHHIQPNSLPERAFKAGDPNSLHDADFFNAALCGNHAVSGFPLAVLLDVVKHYSPKSAGALLRSDFRIARDLDLSMDSEGSPEHNQRTYDLLDRAKSDFAPLLSTLTHASTAASIYAPTHAYRQQMVELRARQDLPVYGTKLHGFRLLNIIKWIATYAPLTPLARIVAILACYKASGAHITPEDFLARTGLECPADLTPYREEVERTLFKLAWFDGHTHLELTPSPVFHEELTIYEKHLRSRCRQPEEYEVQRAVSWKKNVKGDESPHIFQAPNALDREHAEGTGSIYQLICPMTEEVRYIGQTIQPPSRRFTQHLSQGKTYNDSFYNRSSREWLRQLLLRGQAPLMRVVASGVPAGDLNSAEQQHITEAERQGNILNMQGVQRPLSASELQPFHSFLAFEEVLPQAPGLAA